MDRRPVLRPVPSRTDVSEHCSTGYLVFDCDNTYSPSKPRYYGDTTVEEKRIVNPMERKLDLLRTVIIAKIIPLAAALFVILCTEVNAIKERMEALQKEEGVLRPFVMEDIVGCKISQFIAEFHLAQSRNPSLDQSSQRWQICFWVNR